MRPPQGLHATTPHGVSAGLLVMLVGALTAVVRFLAIHGFNNDHFVHLTAAQQGVVARIVPGPHDAHRQDPH